MNLDPHHMIFIVFGKYPEPGVAKTRLIPALGPIGAAEFQRRLSKRVLERALNAARQTGGQIYFFYSGESPEKISRWINACFLGGRFLSIHPQAGESLGERMKNAFAFALNQTNRGALKTVKGSKVILFGTDIPDITTGLLVEAAAKLDDSDIVLGPSADGGYWLIGMKAVHDVFSDIPWSTDAVFGKTVEKAQKKGLSFVALKTLTDVDVPSDLAGISDPSLLPGVQPYISIIIPALNEAEHIQNTIASALSPDVEIIVVDGGSIDHTVETAEKSGAIVLSSPKGRAVQQNTGARAARGDILLFLHADTRLPISFDRFIYDAMSDPEILGGSFLFKTDYKSLLTGPRHRFKRTAMGWIEKMVNVRTRFLRLPYGDQALFIKKEVFQCMGGFPDTSIAEDLFFIRKLNVMGKTVVLPAHAETSARRWLTLGILKTTFINAVIAIGCVLGVSPSKLAPLYRIKPGKK